MAPLSASSRSTKRQKTSSGASTPTKPASSPAAPSSLPFSTRAFQAVKDVVLGKSPNTTNQASGEDAQAMSRAQASNGAMGGLRKSLSALEIWKMARLQNGSTRGMGVSKTRTSSPSRNVSGASTPTMGKRKRNGLQEEVGSGDEEGSTTPSKRAGAVNGIASTTKSGKDRSAIEITVDGEDDEEDPLQVDIPQSGRRVSRMNVGPIVAVDRTHSKSTPSRITKRKRRKPPDTSVEDVVGTREEHGTALKTPKNQETPRKSPRNEEVDEEEAALGFKAIGASRPAQSSEAKKNGINIESDENQADTLRSTTSMPLKKRGRPPKPKADNVTAHPHLIPPVDIHLDDKEQQIALEDAGALLTRALDRTSSAELTEFKSSLFSGLTGKRRLPLVNLDIEYQKVHQLVEQTVLAGEGNSMLLIGSRGCAKTTLVDTVLSDVSVDYSESFHVIRLNGFVHTDDKLALREIWRQLGREMEIEDDAIKGKNNYADTLTSLLALLSHSAQEDPEAETPSIARSVIFVLDEFDLFASHPRQTLLYNLFDVAQSRNAPIAVLGLTTKIDVVESLEKRVKSRFGQRYVHLSQPRTFAAFTAICKAALIPLASNQQSSITGGQIDSHTNPAAVEALHISWTVYVNCLFSTSPFLTHLRSIFATTKSIPVFLSSCVYPISTLSASTIPTPQAFLASSSSLRPPDSKLHTLPSLSELALSLLIAAARLDIILSTDLCNFEMAYEEYVTLASRVKMQTSASGQLAVGGGGGRVWGRAVAKGEWERLVALELVLPATGGTLVGKGKGEQGRMWRVDVGLEEIGVSVKMGAAMARWCREI